MARYSREYRTLDKDLRRVTNIERAMLQSGRPVFRVGIALIFMALAACAATAIFVGQPALGIVAAAMAVAAWLALSIGANDVSNSLSPAVGAGAIGLTTGLLLVAVMEVLGSVIAGGAVTQTLTEGLVGDTLGKGEATARMMLTALLAAGGWITLATRLDAPVSTTHSVVGAIAGAGLASFGPGAVNWPELGMIAIGWVVSPLISGTLAAVLLAVLRNRVIDREDRIAAGRFWLPIMVALTTGLLGSVGAVAWHGLSQGAILALGLAGAGAGWLYARLRLQHEIALNRGEQMGLKKLLGVPLATAAVVMGFAHGSNDASNVAAPLGIILDSLPTRTSLLPQGQLGLLLAGVGIALGVLLFGGRLVHMVGSKITRLSATRALCISLATSATVLGFSAAGLPVSTTHIAVGGVFGIGFYREWHDRQQTATARPELPDEERRRRHLVRRSYMRMILGAWLITVPAAAAMAASLVWIGRQF
jgi:PiT family inorganic phosphate transporter